MKVFYYPITIIFITLICIIFLFSLRTTIHDIRSSTETIEVLDQENKQLASEIFELEDKVSYAQSEFAKEKMARNEMLLQRPGEHIVQLPRLENHQPQEKTNTTLSPWEEWKQLLFTQ